MNTPPVVAVDGPVGAGKGTVSQRVAQALGWHLLDSGALYRIIALDAARAGLALDDEGGLAGLAGSLDIRFAAEPDGPARVVVQGVDVTDRVRSEHAGRGASRVAALPGVRRALLGLQRGFRRPPGLVADGRDMGTVVFADAPLKIFLTAGIQERARRRYKQLIDKGIDVNLANLLEEIAARDERDRERSAAPLKPAEDAVILGTDGLSVDVVVGRVLAAAAARGLTPRHV